MAFPPADAGEVSGQRSWFADRVVDVLARPVKPPAERFRDEDLQRIQDYLRQHVPVEVLSPFGLRKNRRQIIRDAITAALRSGIVGTVDASEANVNYLYENLVALGPIEDLIEDPETTEIIVERWDRICVEQGGRIQHRPDLRFSSEEHLRRVVDHLVALAGREINTDKQFTNFTLLDGSRVHIVVPPVAYDGTMMTIRRAKQQVFTLDDYVRFGTMNDDVAAFLRMVRRAKCSILVAGETGTGKTSLVETLIGEVPDELVITCEDLVQELKPNHPHVRKLVTAPSGIGRTLDALVREALRMRPDLVVVGETRGEEAAALLKALTTGQAGGLTTIHADSPIMALTKMATYAQEGENSAFARSVATLYRTIYHAFEYVVVLQRLPDGSRRVVSIDEVAGVRGEEFLLQNVYQLRWRPRDDGTLECAWRRNPRYLPSPRVTQKLRLLHTRLVYTAQQKNDVDREYLDELLASVKLHLANNEWVPAAELLLRILEQDPTHQLAQRLFERVQRELLARGRAVPPPPAAASLRGDPIDLNDPAIQIAAQLLLAPRDATVWVNNQPVDLHALLPIVLGDDGASAASSGADLPATGETSGVVAVVAAKATYTSKEAAAFLGVSGRELRSLVASGRIQPLRGPDGRPVYAGDALQKLKRELIAERARGLLTAGEAAQLLGVTPKVFKDLVRRGVIQPIRDSGTERRYTPSELERARAQINPIRAGRTYSLIEAARYLGVSPQTVRRLEKQGVLTSRERALPDRYAPEDLALLKEALATLTAPEDLAPDTTPEEH